MGTDKYQNKYRIPSARAAWHDYSGGAYFVTLCTRAMEHHFGEIGICRDRARAVFTTCNGRDSDIYCRRGVPRLQYKTNKKQLSIILIF